MPDLLDTVARGIGYLTMFCVTVGVLAIVGNAAVERIVSGRRPKPEPEVRGCVDIVADAWTGPELNRADNGVDMDAWRKRRA